MLTPGPESLKLAFSLNAALLFENPIAPTLNPGSPFRLGLPPV